MLNKLPLTYILLSIMTSVVSFHTVVVNAQPPTKAVSDTSTIEFTTEIEDYSETTRFDSQDLELRTDMQEVQLSFKELCKTEQGRQLILNIEDSLNVRDQLFQWQGLRANDQSTESTFEEYRKSNLNRRCSDRPADYEFIIGLAEPKGTCQDVKFGPPHYDIEATVKKIQELDTYYRTTSDPWAGANDLERKDNLIKNISSLLGSIEASLSLSYANTRCKVGNTGRCAASTGEKRLCEKVYIYAPPYQVLVPHSLRGGQHIKEGPILQSPTVAWFRVGKTGHGENWGTATAESTFSEDGATKKAKMDVDAIRRNLINRGLPTDKIPPKLEEPINIQQPKKDPTRPLPAKLYITYRERPGNRNFYDVQVVNSGGSPATFSFRIWYYDGFFQSGSAKRKEKATRSFVIQAGNTYTESFHDFHALSWEFERL